MGHAGAIISGGGEGRCEEKFAAFRRAGIAYRVALLKCISMWQVLKRCEGLLK